MAFLYQKLKQDEIPPAYTLADYDINLVVDTALQIAADKYALPMRKKDGEENDYFDPKVVFPKEDWERLEKKRADLSDALLKEWNENQTKTTLSLYAKYTREDYRQDWTEKERHTIEAYRIGRDRLFKAHFNERLARDTEVQELLRKRFEGRRDPRINELYGLFALLNANPLPEPTEEQSPSE